MPNLIELIQKKELDTFCDYAEKTQGYKVLRDHNVLFRHWNANKQDLYRLLDNNFIISKPIVYEKDVSELRSQLARSVYESKVYQDCKDILERFRYNTDEYWELMWGISEYEGWINNAWQRSSVIIPAEDTPTNKTIKISKGMRLTKVVEKLLKGFNKYNEIEYEQFRIAHSVCLNDLNVKGTLSLSIHPLDYATMSDNACDWNSCMSWYDDGEYRQGTLEMMNSPYVVVAYITSQHKPSYKLYGCNNEWTNKKWRKLYVVSPEVIMGIKAYPYPCEEIDKICLDWLKELAQTNWNAEYLDEMYRIGRQCTCGNIWFDFYTNLMYNDIYCGAFHEAYIGKRVTGDCELHLSGPSLCLRCGGSDIVVPDSFECCNCGDYIRCDGCGEWVREEDAVYYNGGNYCSGCAEDVWECADCGRNQFGESYVVAVMVNEKILYYQDICYDCYEAVKEYLDPDDRLELTQFKEEDDFPGFVSYGAIDQALEARKEKQDLKN